MKRKILKNQRLALPFASVIISFALIAIPSYCQTEIPPGDPKPANIQPTENNDAHISSQNTDLLANKQNQGQAKDANTIDKTKKASLQKKVLSVATALLVGTPICMVRRSKYEEWYGVHGMVGDCENKTKKVVLGTLWLPCAVFSGVLEAPFDAAANGIMYPAFSKDQMSKGKLIQNN